MNTVTIVRGLLEAHDTIKAGGKTPWLVLNGDAVAAVFPARGQARDFKEANGGRVVKADEVGFAQDPTEMAEREAHNAQIAQDADDIAAALAKDEGAAEPAVAPKEAKAKPEVLHESSIVRPCKRVFAIADEMLETHPGAKRKDVLERCVAEGIAYYTARTQYQQWLSVRKEMAEREATQAAKAKA